MTETKPQSKVVFILIAAVFLIYLSGLIVFSSVITQLTNDAELGYIKESNIIGFSAKTSISATTNAWTSPSFDTEMQDTDDAFDGTTFTVPANGGGIYGISGVFVFSSITNGNRYIVGISVNGVQVSYILGRGTAGSTNLQGVGGHVQIPLNAGDTVKLVTYTDNPTTGWPTEGYSSFSAYKIRE